MKHLLNKTKAPVLWTNKAEAAVILALENEVYLFLMDIKMPVLSGFEATWAIKKLKKTFL